MKTLSPGKFEIEIGGETRVVLVSLGLKTELYKIITTSQLEMAKLTRNVFLNDDIAAQIQATDAEVKSLEAAEADTEEITAKQEELEALYAQAMTDLESRQQDAFNSAVMEKITLSEKVFANAISCLLSERDAVGNVTTKLEPDVIMWSPVYAEAQEELTDLLHGVTEYITSALKKISAINLMVNETTEAAVG